MPFMEEVSFAAIPALYSENTYHTTSPAHYPPSRSSALHYGRPCVIPYSYPYYALPPIRQHDTHSCLHDSEPLHGRPSPLIWAAHPQACGAHPGPSYASPAASHQLQSTCGCGTCPPRVLWASDVGSSRVLPQQLPSRSYSTGSLGSHFAHANPCPARSRSTHAPSRASPSTIITLPFPPPPAPLTRRSDTPPRQDDIETKGEVDCEKSN
jgi:hypothetical protein